MSRDTALLHLVSRPPTAPLPPISHHIVNYSVSPYRKLPEPRATNPSHPGASEVVVLYLSLYPLRASGSVIRRGIRIPHCTSARIRLLICITGSWECARTHWTAGGQGIIPSHGITSRFTKASLARRWVRVSIMRCRPRSTKNQGTHNPGVACSKTSLALDGRTCSRRTFHLLNIHSHEA